MTQPICAVLIHVPDVPAGLQWYQSAFVGSELRHVSDFDFTYLEFKGVGIEIVPSDEKVSSGAAGSVVYWTVDDFDAALAHFVAAGATLYRGPGKIEEGKLMCQVRDPWGNCIGLRD